MVTDKADFSQLLAPFWRDWKPPTWVTLLAAGHLPVKLPDYNNRLRVLVATYVAFSPNGTELLVNMGGEQVWLAPRGGPSPCPPPPHPAARAGSATSPTMRQTRSLTGNDVTVKYGNAPARLEFPEKYPGLECKLQN